MDGDSITSTSDAPSSTITLFGNILKNAEADANNDRGDSSKKLKLFHVATKLAKLNLLEDETPGSNAVIWDIVLGFLHRYPDYVLYRPASDSLQNGHEADENGENEQEEMGIWLLPRLLRRLAVMGADKQPTEKVNKLRKAAEDWIASMVHSLAEQFYSKETNGVAKQREIVNELLALLRSLQAIVHADSTTKSFPIKLWMFQKGARPVVDAAAGDPFISQDRRNKRPFSVSIDNLAQANALYSSLLRVLLSTIQLSSTWINDAVPEIVEAICGTPQNWDLQTDKKGKGKSSQSTKPLLDRLELATSFFSTERLRFYPTGAVHRILQRVVQVFEAQITAVDQVADLEAHKALFDCLSALLKHDCLSSDTNIASLLRSAVLDRAQEIIILLTEQPAVVDVDTGNEDIPPLQACCLIFLSAEIWSPSTTLLGRLAHPEMTKRQLACEVLSENHRSQLVTWLEEHIQLSLRGSNKRSGPFAKARRDILAALVPTAGKKRSIGQVEGEASPGERASRSAALADTMESAFGVQLEEWESRGWVAWVKGNMEGKSPSAKELQGISRLVCLDSALRLGDEHINTANYVCKICDIPSRETRAKLDEIYQAVKALLVGSGLVEIKQRAAAWVTLGVIFEHHDRPPMFMSDIAKVLLRDLDHKSRIVRLAAGQAGNSLVKAHMDCTPGVGANGHLSQYFDRLDKLILQPSLTIKSTAITTAIQLCRHAEDGILGKALCLVISGLTQRGHLKAFIATQLGNLWSYRKTAAYKFFAPHFDVVCPLLAQKVDNSFILLQDFCQLIHTSPKAFLQSQNISRIFLVTAVLDRKEEIVDQLSALTETNIVELIILNADCIFAPLYFQSPAKLSECTTFVLRLLEQNGVKFTLQQMLESSLPSLLLEVLVRADPSPSGKQILSGVLQRIYQQADHKTPWQTQLTKSSTVLAVFGRAGDVLRGMYGKKSTADRVKVLEGMSMFVEAIGAQISCATPQIMSTLQSSLKDPLIRLPTLALWDKFVRTLIFEDVRPLLAQSTATFVQSWTLLRDNEKQLVKQILHYFIVEKKAQLGSEIHSIANLEGIEDLATLQLQLATSRQQQNFISRLEGYLKRLDTVNEAVLVQALRELLVFLQQEAIYIHKIAVGSSFHPCLGQLVHGLLNTAIRNTEAKTQARALALRCLGILGALDPDRLTFPPEEEAFPLRHDLKEEEECKSFAMYVIEKVLVKVLRSTNDPQQQAALFLAIQGLAAVCGFDNKLRLAGQFQQGVDAATRQRWNAIPKAVRDVMEPLISTQIDVQLQTSEKNQYPLYLHKPTYRDWLQAWTSDLITQLVQGHAGFKSRYGPEALFAPLRAACRRGHDLSVAYFILPYLVFYTLGGGNTNHSSSISAEVEKVLQDQISPKEGLSMTMESRSLCAQAVFELMDSLNTWVRARHVFIAKKYRKRESSKAPEMENALFSVKRVERMFKNLPQTSVAEAAFNSKSYARALLNYEKVLYDLKNSEDATRLQPYYERMHHIYAELNEPDGMEGVSTSIISPSIQHQIREHEMTGRWTSAQSCWEVQLQLQPEDPNSHLGLLRCLRNLGHYDSLRTHITGLQSKHEEWKQLLSPYEVESALIAGDLDTLSEASTSSFVSCPEAAFGQLVLAKMRQGDVETVKNQAAEVLGGIITTASKDSYHRFYEAIVNLHILHEMDTLLLPAVEGVRRHQNRAEVAAFTARLDMTSPTFHTRESILNMRRNAYRISAGIGEPNIGPLWLATSKIALKAEHLQTAYSAILQATQFQADFTFVQSAKLYRANNQLYRALQEIDQGLNGLGALDSSKKQNIDPDVAKQLAKATLRSARWMQESGRFDNAEIHQRYRRAILLNPSWEAAYYRFGQYADDIVQVTTDFNKSAVPNSPSWHRNTTLLTNMEVVVHNFSKALRYGTKFLYQSLPRLLTIWLDFAEREELRYYDPSKGQNVPSASAAKQRRPSTGKDKDEPAIKEGQKTSDKLANNIRRAFEKLPPYMWLAVLPQLASRLWHDNASVCSQLMFIIERVVQHHPQQSMWTMIGVLHSEVKIRRERCQQILQRAQSKNPNLNPAQRTALSHTMSTLDALVRCFLEVSASPSESNALSMKHHFPKLRNMVPCNIIIPFQDSMTVTLPTDPAQLLTHRAFPDNLITFAAFDDAIELMVSVARPRKLVIHGSDGSRYRFLCKPLDDLRKDNRLMECTSLVNRLLMKDAESRKRSLRIRTYAVIPLNEICGLIEWVPDTAGVRGLWVKSYESKGISVWNDGLKRIYDTLKTAQKNDPIKCGDAFSKQILPAFPPIFHEWFLDNFPEPTAWLKARTAFGRTAAVMSMVGFVLGLGDRHGENILIDTTNGDVVHVDFNCLFGMGLVWFDIVEKVPFRLTQNMIDGFGITGVEGVYRKVCEVTMRILRENKNSLISVLESFVHDPLLDLQLSRPGVQRKSLGSGRNETKEQKAAREQEMRKEEARRAIVTIGSKLRGTQSTLNGPPGETVSSVEMTVETLFKEAGDPKNLGGMYCGWAAWT